MSKKKCQKHETSDQTKTISATAGALFSLAIVGYLLTPLSQQTPLSTDLSVHELHHGRKLMGFEEKALAKPDNTEIELSATDYWLDDVLQVCKN